MSKKSFPSYQFLEIGVSVNSADFFIVFAAPRGLAMRTYSAKSQSIQPLALEDWLLSDFPVLLGRRLMARPGTEIKLVSYRPINPGSPEFNPVAVYQANSTPDSWMNPFVCLFASQFVNNV